MEQKTGCLVIHGFGGSFREIGPLAAALEERGIIVRCPVLKGHTGIVRDLKEVAYTDWIESAEEELKCLKQQCDAVFIIGFSMGGLIGMQLANRYRVSGLITINTPIFYFDFKKIISNIFSDIRTRNYINIRRYLKPSNRLPLTALWNFRLLLKETKQLIPAVAIPVMIAQSIDDDVVHHTSAGYIYTHIGSGSKKLATYPRGGHILLLSESAHALITDIFRFIAETALKIPVTAQSAK
jgi:carboxylesterase